MPCRSGTCSSRTGIGRMSSRRTCGRGVPTCRSSGRCSPPWTNTGSVHTFHRRSDRAGAGHARLRIRSARHAPPPVRRPCPPDHGLDRRRERNAVRRVTGHSARARVAWPHHPARSARRAGVAQRRPRRPARGGPKPTLLNLRNWRKSVAVALALEGRPGFAWVRYEDLVSSPSPILDGIARTLGIDAFSWRPGDGVENHGGQPWPGNSSHHDVHGVSQASVGVWRTCCRTTLASTPRRSACPSLEALGYPESMWHSRTLSEYWRPSASPMPSPVARWRDIPRSQSTSLLRSNGCGASTRPPTMRAFDRFHGLRAHDVLRMAVSR